MLGTNLFGLSVVAALGASNHLSVFMANILFRLSLALGFMVLLSFVSTRLIKTLLKIVL